MTRKRSVIDPLRAGIAASVTNLRSPERKQRLGEVVRHWQFAANGTATYVVGVPNVPSLMGFTLSVQGLSTDAGAPGGIVLTNARTLVVGI